MANETKTAKVDFNSMLNSFADNRNTKAVETEKANAVNIYGICNGQDEETAKKQRRIIRKELYALLSRKDTGANTFAAFKKWCEKYQVDCKKGWHGTAKNEAHAKLIANFEPIVTQAIKENLI